MLALGSAALLFWPQGAYATSVDSLSPRRISEQIQDAVQRGGLSWLRWFFQCGVGGITVTRGCGVVTSNYGPRWGRFHYGTDIGAPVGTQVRTPVAGTFHPFYNRGACGNGFEVRNQAYIFRVCHVRPDPKWRPGSFLQAGEKGGTIDLSGRTTGPHVHGELYVCQNGKSCTPVDPRRYLANKDNLWRIAQANQKASQGRQISSISPDMLMSMSGQKYGIGGPTALMPSSVWSRLVRQQQERAQSNYWSEAVSLQKQYYDLFVQLEQQKLQLLKAEAQAMLDNRLPADTEWDRVVKNLPTEGHTPRSLFVNPSY